MTPKPDHRSPESGSEEEEIKRLFRWLGRRFVRLAFYRYVGWGFVVLVAIGLAATGTLLLLHGHQTILYPDIALWFFTASFLCVALLFAMLRHRLRGATTEWPALDFAGRVGRLALVIAGTASFAAPFVFVAWLMLSR